MHFCDETQIICKAGNGGNGAVSFHREKFVAHGGPDGGNGGKGGDIVLKTSVHINTLVNINSRKSYKAEDGDNGAKKNQWGRGGEDLVLEVPIGTLVKSEDGTTVIADLSGPNDVYVICAGGIGGKGNAQFASSIRQAPEFAELGEPGEEKTINLELKLVADIGIIGLPSAGKSTLISKISSAKPKIADYPFTTLVPNLGVVDLGKFGGDKGTGFTVVDIPGLIEGASEGKGLGHEFLRHVGRAKILIHLVDGTLKDLTEKINTINAELKKYSTELSKKRQVLVVNKIDMLFDEYCTDIEAELKKISKKDKIYFISAITGDGLKQLVFDLKKIVEMETIIEVPKVINIEQHKVFTPHLLESSNVEIIEHGVEVIKNEKREREHRMTHREREIKKELKMQLENEEITNEEFEEKLYELKNGFKKSEKVVVTERKIFEIINKKLYKIVSMTNMANSEAVDRVIDVIKKMDINKKLKAKGAKNGDVIKINDKTFYFKES